MYYAVDMYIYIQSKMKNKKTVQERYKLFTMETECSIYNETEKYGIYSGEMSLIQRKCQGEVRLYVFTSY